jgi:uncharacterized tellurite resistance protein B-like protein
MIYIVFQLLYPLPSTVYPLPSLTGTKVSVKSPHLKRYNMTTQTTILSGYSDREKGAYLGAIASLSTADRSASEEELDYIDALIESADISEEQASLIRHAATADVADSDLERFLEVLKTSDLRFSLVSDVIAFAQADNNYTDQEKAKVQEIASYLGVNQEQFSVLDQFTQKAVEEVPQHAEELETEKTTPANFLDSLGFGDKLKSAGINSSSLFKTALGVVGPILLAKMFTGRSGRNSMGGGGLLGGVLGSVLGSGMLGGLMGGKGSGGLLGGLLGGGRGFGGAAGMLGRILGKRS